MSPKSVPSQGLENIRETAGVHDTLLLCDKGHVMQALPTTWNTRLSLSLRDDITVRKTLTLLKHTRRRNIHLRKVVSYLPGRDKKSLL